VWDVVRGRRSLSAAPDRLGRAAVAGTITRTPDDPDSETADNCVEQAPRSRDVIATRFVFFTVVVTVSVNLAVARLCAATLLADGTRAHVAFNE